MYMEQTKPIFLIQKYRSILGAAIVVEAVTYIISLTDTLIAGNMVSNEAMAAVGLVAPLISAVAFVTSVINTGTLLSYSRSVGNFEKERANGFFSQGVLLSLSAGALIALCMFLARESFIGWLGISSGMAQDVRDYYNVILFWILLGPLTCLLDNCVVADGGEKLSAVVNVIQIVANVALSVVFSLRWGVGGIALASGLSQLLSLLLIGIWFFRPQHTLRFVWHWDFSDCKAILQSGVVKASVYALSSFAAIFLNAFAVARFGEESMVALTVAEKMMASSVLFLALTMTVQPIIGTLLGERNFKAIRLLMHVALKDMVVMGIGLSVLTAVFAPFFANAFGVENGEAVYSQCVEAVRLVGATLFGQAALSLFFGYYILIGKGKLAFFICVCKEIVCPLGMVFLAVSLTGAPAGLWIGLSLASVVSVLLCALVVVARYGKENVPFLITKESESNTYIYDYPANEENAVALSKEAGSVLEANGYSKDLQILTGMIFEDAMMLIKEKNPDVAGLIQMECTIILKPEKVRLILRDSGQIFDLASEDAALQSYRQVVFMVCYVSHIQHSNQLATTGYNRHLILLSAKQSDS